MCGRRVVHSSCEAGEKCELWVETSGKALIIGEDNEGPLTEAVYGEPWHRSMLRVDASEFARVGGLNDEILGGDAPLCDLMDVLDKAGVPYSYMGLGSGGAMALRGKQSKMDFSQTLDVRAGA